MSRVEYIKADRQFKFDTICNGLKYEVKVEFKLVIKDEQAGYCVDRNYVPILKTKNGLYTTT